MIEHPMITQIERTGYPADMVEQSEHFGIDYYGNEIVSGDDVVEDKEAGELILKDDLEKYLEEVYGFKFFTAE
ncbi:YqaI family protein [Fictibacillus gelatini]|uniref:YqaI family protein n=1 Tax=Fictibacillus gelatini TaxID=225985 RepID=UPI00041CD616|nr:hypothetical protein [Fictibacillus gelatini]